MIKINAAGTLGGKQWDDKGCNIAQIFISHGKLINGIQFQFVDENGHLVLSDPHGLMGPPQFHTVKLKYPSEYITWVSGHSGEIDTIEYGNITLETGIEKWGITSIEFGTNETTYGPFGSVSDGDERFEYHLGQNNQFGGFHGTSEYWKLNSIGVYLKPASTLSELTELEDASQVF